MTAQPPALQEAPARPLILRVEDVHITYRVHSDHHQGLRERMLRRDSWVDVHAVRGVSFELREGEILGVIGANGSGKSSLLRAIAGLVPVSAGRILARYRPVRLGVGAALNRNLSGRRNIYLGCLALGMSARDAGARIDEIIEFSGLSASIDLPLRTYSSGMRARLQFSIATAVMPELLLLDEVLAAGDAEFRERSQERLRELRQQAGAAVIVSHNRREITNVCTRALWLSQGQVREQGTPEAIVDAYSASVERKKPAREGRPAAGSEDQPKSSTP